MKRENAFFGVHFDFHAMHGQAVGEDFRPDVVAKMLDELKPDFAQCDTKGHEGLSSYATKAGTQADEIKTTCFLCGARLHVSAEYLFTHITRGFTTGQWQKTIPTGQ